MMKKWDIIIIVLLILFSFLPQIIWSTSTKSTNQNTYAYISVHGAFYKKIPLSSHIGTDDFTIKTKYGFNTIRVSKNSIQIIDADCKDKICIKEGKISKPGETIACLPHKLLIEIKSSSKKEKTIIPVG